jgi:hypothetical protein
MKRNVPYAIILPIVVVCFAVMLMIWSMAGTSGGGGGQEHPSSTTGNSSSQPNASPVRVPSVPNNDAGADSARTGNGPLNKSR